MDNSAVYYGKPLDYDPDFRGPVKRRSCTDVVCLYLFIGFILIWFGIGIYALVSGNPRIHTEGFNITTVTCDEKKPYLLYLDIAKCKKATFNLCDSTNVCLSECPTEEFLFNKNRPNAYQKVYCTNVKPKNNAEAEALIRDDKCSLYYFPSKPMENICVPTEYNFTDMYRDPSLKTRNITLETIDDAVKTLKMLVGVDEVFAQVVKDIHHVWPIMLAALGIAICITIVYILIMRWVAGVMIWACFAALTALLILCIVISAREYANFDELHPDVAPEDHDAQKTTGLILAIFFSILLLVFLLVLIFLRKKIFLAIALIKESSKAIGHIISSLFFPIIPSLLQLGLFVFGLCVAVYLASIGERYYVVNNLNTTDCICSRTAANYTNGGECLPEIFANECFDPATHGACETASCSYAGLKQSPVIIVFHSVNVVAIYWVLFFMTAFMEIVLAGAFATWFWSMPKSEVEFWTVSKSLGRTFRYHLGTIAFGSFIITVVRLLRMMLDAINRNLRESGNTVAVCLVSCCECFFSFVERVLKFITRNAYIVCSIHGDNFCASTKEATSLVMRNLTRVIVIDNVTDFLLFLSKFLITLGMGCITYTMLDCCTTYKTQQIWFPVLIMVIISYLVATVFFNVYSMAVDTLFICYLEDIERNDGTPDKPYYMPNKLKEIFAKDD